MTTDELWPRVPAYRYRLVAVAGDERPRVLAAAPDPGGLGQAIVTLHEDAKASGRSLAEEGSIGVLDVFPGGQPRATGEWVINPYYGR